MLTETQIIEFNLDRNNLLLADTWALLEIAEKLEQIRSPKLDAILEQLRELITQRGYDENPIIRGAN